MDQVSIPVLQIALIKVNYVRERSFTEWSADLRGRNSKWLRHVNAGMESDSDADDGPDGFRWDKATEMAVLHAVCFGAKNPSVCFQNRINGVIHGPCQLAEVIDGLDAHVMPMIFRFLDTGPYKRAYM